MAEKVTTMVLKVDLQCSSCYKKIKKILCKFPQIRDQIYDEKQNTVTIVVVCCSPEKVRDKLYCKGRKTIKCIEIKPPKPSKPPEDPKPSKPPEDPKPSKPSKPPEDPKPSKPSKPPEDPKPPVDPKPSKPPKEPPPCPPAFVPAFVPVCYPPMYPVGICCGQCYGGRTDGPCYHGHGRPVPPCDNYGYGPSGYGGHRVCYTSRCDYFSEENTSGCTTM